VKLNFRNMKYSVLFSILLLVFFVTQTAQQVSAADGEVIKIDGVQFKTQIMDYEKNPKEWKFEGKLPCIVDFYADWCGPCRLASPALEELAKKYKGKIVVYKVNTDQERELSTVFGISGIPAFLWVPQTGNPTMTSGVARSPEEIIIQFEKMINDVLLKSKP
jgi:thioredoxin 1